MENENLHRALLGALALAGNNQSKFGAAIGASQQNVSYWVKKKRPLPAEYVLPAERAGFGSRHRLRPDLYPRDDAAASVCGTCDEALTDVTIRRCNVDLCPHAQREAA